MSAHLIGIGEGVSMRGKLGRIGVLASAILLAVTGTVSASAGELAAPRDAAAAVRASHDQLRDAAAAGDVDKVRATLAELTPLLTELATGQRNALPAGSRELVDAASEATAAAQDELARVDVPPLPQLLAQFLEQVFQILILLVESLLGGGVPVAN